MYYIFTAILWDREDSSNPILIIRKVRRQDLIAFLQVVQLHTSAECILNTGLLKYFSLIPL